MTQEHVNKQTLDTVNYWYRQGFVSYVQWQEYRCLWRNSAPRFSDECSEHDNHDANNCPLVKP